MQYRKNILIVLILLLLIPLNLHSDSAKYPAISIGAGISRHFGIVGKYAVDLLNTPFPSSIMIRFFDCVELAGFYKPVSPGYPFAGAAFYISPRIGSYLPAAGIGFASTITGEEFYSIQTVYSSIIPLRFSLQRFLPRTIDITVSLCELTIGSIIPLNIYPSWYSQGNMLVAVDLAKIGFFVNF